MAPSPFADVVPRITLLIEANRDAARAAPMAAYMRNKFTYAGIPAPLQKVLFRDALAGLPAPSQKELEATLRELWGRREREYQYAGAHLAGKYVRLCDPSFLAVLRELVTTKSWWDTVDALAGPAGALVRSHADLVPAMDQWIEADDFWLQRVAILHQLKYRDTTDQARLFRYCLARSGDGEFFIRKAIGWALREYSKTDVAAVRDFVAKNEQQLSGLSRREALLWLNGGRRGLARRD